MKDYIVYAQMPTSRMWMCRSIHNTLKKARAAIKHERTADRYLARNMKGTALAKAYPNWAKNMKYKICRRVITEVVVRRPHQLR